MGRSLGPGHSLSSGSIKSLLKTYHQSTTKLQTVTVWKMGDVTYRAEKEALVLGLPC